MGREKDGYLEMIVFLSENKKLPLAHEQRASMRSDDHIT